MAIYENNTLKEHPIYGSSRLGVHYRQSGTDAYQLTDHLGNVRAVIMKNGENAVSLTAKTDYYPGGMAMPNRQLVGGELYRYGYQGEFAETDPETGKPAFQLRLYDPRINRWLTTDPKGEFASPYLAMGNNWVNTIDPDGGSTAPPDDYKLNKDGSIELVQLTDDNFDRLFVDSAGVDPIIVNDQSILSSLSTPNGNGVRVATTGMGSRDDIMKVFLAGANYSNAEWIAGKMKTSQYFVGTKMDPDFSPTFSSMGLDRNNVSSFVHSHPNIYVAPGQTFFEAEKSSMGYNISRGVAYGDWGNTVNEVKNNDGKYPFRKYVYIPESGKLWRVGYNKPHYIRNIKNNHSRFFFGTF